MKHHRLAIVRQKYRPDGGAERFVSRALTALSNQNLENAENAQQLLTSVLSVSEKLNTYQAQE